MIDRKARISAWILPRLQDVFFLAIFVAVLALGQRMLNTDGDFPRHLLTGRYILQTGTIPTTEPFIYPYAGQPYVSHEWLADLIFYLIYRYAGLIGIVVLSATLLASAFTLLYAEASSRFDLRIPILFLIAWGAAASSLNWIVRPHLFSMLLLAIWLVWANRLARGENIALWQFPVLMLLWSNLHGEFIAGILVMLAYAAGWVWDYLFNRADAKTIVGKKIGLGLLFSLAASLVNPAGFGPWKTLLTFVNNPYLMSRMAESNPPNFQQPVFYVFLGLLIFSLVLLALKKEKLSAGQAFLLAGFSAMSLTATRNIHLYGIVVPFVLAGTMNGIREVGSINHIENILHRIDSQLKGVLWPVSTIIASSVIFLSRPTVRQLYHFDGSFFPVEAVQWLETHPQEGHMFNDLNWGGYIAFHLWPEHPTFIDSMADVRGDITRQYETVITLSDGWQEVLTKYSIAWVILPTDSPFIIRLDADPAWETLYSDSTATILLKK